MRITLEFRELALQSLSALAFIQIYSKTGLGVFVLRKNGAYMTTDLRHLAYNVDVG